VIFLERKNTVTKKKKKKRETRKVSEAVK